MKTHSFLFAFIFLLVLLSVTASAELLGERFIQNSSGSTGVTSGGWKMQMFTIGNTGANVAQNVSNVSFLYYKTGIGVLLVGIKSVNASGQPVGADFFNGSVNTTGFALGAPLNWINISMIGNGTLLQPSTQYGIVVRQLYGDGEFGVNSTGNYTGGNWSRNDAAGVGEWVAQAGDAPFKVFYNGTLITNAFQTVLDLPADGAVTSATTINFSAHLVMTGFTATNATIYVWNSATSLFNRTTNAMNSAVSNTTNWTISNFSEGSYIWNVYGCGINASSFRFCAFADANRTFTVIPLSVDSSTYNTSVYETSYQTFTINFTTFPGVLSASAIFFYNGTRHLATTSCSASGSCYSSASIDIPVISGLSQLFNFFWSVTTFDGSSSTTSNVSQSTQTVNRINIEQCNATWTDLALNFTAYDEQNLTRITPFLFQGTFRTWLGTGTQYRNTSINLLSVAEVDICISPSNLTYHTNADIQYNNVANSTVYNTRNYFLRNATLTNVSQSIPLYLLQSVSSTSFILEVTDENLVPIADALIYIQRYYPGLDTYNTVQIALTDANGKSIGFFETETVEYKFIIIKNGQVLLTTEKRKVFPESSPFTLTFRIGSVVSNTFAPYQNITNLLYSLTYNETSRMVVFTYIDTSGVTQYGRLLVQVQNPSGSPTTVCNTNSTQAAATIECNVTGYEGNIIARAYIGRGPEQLVALINSFITTAIEIFGEGGMLMGLLIILAIALLTVYNQILQVIAVNVTIILLSIIGLITFSPIFIFGIMAVSTIILVILRQ